MHAKTKRRLCLALAALLFLFTLFGATARAAAADGHDTALGSIAVYPKPAVGDSEAFVGEVFIQRVVPQEGRGGNEVFEGYIEAPEPYKDSAPTDGTHAVVFPHCSRATTMCMAQAQKPRALPPL